MRTRRDTRTIYIVVAIAVVVIAFLLLGGLPWVQGMGHGRSSMGMTSLRWGQILISLGLGFLIGWFASKRKLI
jgi:DNA-binding transcriptional regulator of glucitol operon